MAHVRATMIELFSEEHYTSDEEVMHKQQVLKRQIYDAFGTDSESEEPTKVINSENTDISDCGEEIVPYCQTQDDLIDVIELAHSDISDTEEVVTQTISRIQLENRRPKTLAQVKALAQYRRQMAARITKCEAQAEMSIPHSIVVTDSSGQPIHLKEAEIVMDENEFIQQAEKSIYGKSIVDATLESIHKQQKKRNLVPQAELIENNNIKCKSYEPIEEVRRYENQMKHRQESVPSTPVTTAASSVLKIGRRERRQGWYKKKKKSINPIESP